MKSRLSVAAWAAVLLLVACAAPSGEGYLLMFNEKDAVTDFSPTRMIVTAAYLRIDEGPASDGFVLFDRRARTIYSVSDEDKTILVIEEQAGDFAPPKGLEHRVEEVPLEGAPAVGGRKVRHYNLYTNERRCYELFAVEGLLEEPRRALEEYRRVLAQEHAQVASLTPADMQDQCDLANNVLLPARHLAHGFPIRMQDVFGRVRNLQDYDVHYRPDPALFVLPAGYRRYTPAEMRGG